MEKQVHFLETFVPEDKHWNWLICCVSVQNGALAPKDKHSNSLRRWVSEDRETTMSRTEVEQLETAVNDCSRAGLFSM